MNTCDSNNFATSKTIRCVINYMLLEHLINCRQYLSFQDIVSGTGLSPKTIRRVLKILKQLNIVRTVFDLTNNRRTLYSLIPGKAWKLHKPDDIKPGLYIVDIGLGLPKYLNLKSLRLLRSAEHVLYTPNVPNRIIELVSTENIDNILSLSQYEIKRFLNSQSSNIRVILVDKILDRDVVDNIIKNVECKESVYYVNNVSPIHIAINMLEFPCRKRLRFKRDSNIELVITCNISDLNFENVIKLIKVFKVDHSIHVVDLDIEEFRDVKVQCQDSIYIAYLKSS